jgi:hypothetical protein
VVLCYSSPRCRTRVFSFRFFASLPEISSITSGRPVWCDAPAMGSALDNAERALVVGSFAKASACATAARAVARTGPAKVAAECVWVQAEYKRGGLGESVEGDARRVAGMSGDPFGNQTLLLWAKLKLVGAPRWKASRPEGTTGGRRRPDSGGDSDSTCDCDRSNADAARAEAAAADALAFIFRDAARRHGDEYINTGTEDEDTNAGTENCRKYSTHESENHATVASAAWLYAVAILCDRRGDCDGALDFVRGNFSSLPKGVGEMLVALVSSKRTSVGGLGGVTADTDVSPSTADGTTAEGTAGADSKPAGLEFGATQKTKTESAATNSRPDGRATGNDGAEGTRTRTSQEDTQSSSSLSVYFRGFGQSAFGLCNRGFASAVATTNETFGCSLRPDEKTAKLGGAIVSLAVVGFAYAAVVETKRNPPQWLRSIGRWI